MSGSADWWRGLALSAAASAVLSGCGTLPNGRGWGEDAAVLPGWERVRTSVVDAARDPWVWAPLVGAAAFQIDDWDRRTSDWARKHTPVFGSEHNAENWSDDLRSASVWAHYLTIAATPGGAQVGEWLLSKAKGSLVQVAAVSATSNLTSQLKGSADRERPNGAADESFPSGHTSSSAVHTRLASENLETIAMSRGARRTLDVGLTALTIGTSCARIEAGWHFPSDTLVGMALGNFVGSFVDDAFLGIDESSLQVAFWPMRDGAAVQVRFAF
ncbi:MAG TPA: phosphatase PAP2 family protein [Steroidobacter sp.]|nr:phosphatase PAP2 family protein [Steroidobacter sp.]